MEVHAIGINVMHSKTFIKKIGNNNILFLHAIYMKEKFKYAYYFTGGLVLLLFIQFILGIYINLYVNFPPITSHGFMRMPMTNFIPIMIHMVFGFLILFASFIIFYLMLKISDNVLIISSTISFIFVLIAGLSGFLFLFNESNTYSFLMAFSFIVIFVLQFVNIYRLSRIQK